MIDNERENREGTSYVPMERSTVEESKRIIPSNFLHQKRQDGSRAIKLDVECKVLSSGDHELPNETVRV